MEVSTRSIGGVVVVDVQGDLDRHSAPDLDSALAAVIATSPPRIVLNMAEVGLLDSTGLGVLVKAFREVSAFSGSIAVAATNPTVRKVLEVTGLATLLHLCDSVDDACASG